MMPRLLPAHWLASVTAVGGAGLLVYWWSLSRPLWVDEEMLLLNVRWRSFAELAGPLWLDQSAPLGWLALEKAALLAFGLDERAVRALPVCFGIAMLAVALWIGRRWMSPIAAALLVALCAIGPWVVFFTLELKHYSSDTCFALLLPALAAWATEGPDPERVKRRAAVWWLAASAASWFSNGATFVVPACALVLAGRIHQQHGRHSAIRACAWGIAWLVSFAAHYTLALRHALGNEYLDNYWAFAFPPIADGMSATLHWTLNWLRSFPEKPVGTEHWGLFWAAAIGGFVYASRRYGALGLAFASVPVSALALGMFQIVPPFERLGLWSVPALYVGLALCADAAWWLARQHRGRTARVAAVAAALAAGIVSLDIIDRGNAEIGARRADNNYQLDDRSAIRRLQGMRRTGDPVLTTHFGLAGLWWYAGVDVSGPQRGAYLHDSPVFELSHETRRSRCARYRKEWDAILRRTGRAVVYLGFRMNVEPAGFDKLVLDELGAHGAVVSRGRYADLSHVVEFDFTQPPDGASNRYFEKSSNPEPPPLDGCVAIRPALRW